jgi:DNA-binding NtrC family response regulator
MGLLHLEQREKVNDWDVPGKMFSYPAGTKFEFWAWKAAGREVNNLSRHEFLRTWCARVTVAPVVQLESLLTPFMQHTVTNNTRKTRGKHILPALALYDPSNPVGVDEFVPEVSVAMCAVRETLTRLAEHSVPVLLVGESGTGKTTLALELHRTGVGRTGSFTRIDCSRVPTGFFDLTLSSGDRQKAYPGISNGTLLLQGINELPITLQAKAVRAIAAIFAAPAENFGALRVIATADKELQNEVHAGRFREDLYYLISGVSLRLPPLRYRRADIPILADHFLGKAAAELQRPKPTFGATMLRFLFEYPWPGNIAELRDVVRMIVAVGDEGLAIAALRSRAQEVQRSDGLPRVISLKQAARVASRNAERELMLKVLSRTMWNRKHAAQQLQISYKALLYKLKQNGLHNCADS